MQHTSLVHAYLFVSVTPLAIAVGALLLRKPISVGEVAGTVLGVAGAAVLTLGPKSGHHEVQILMRFIDVRQVCVFRYDLLPCHLLSASQYLRR